MTFPDIDCLEELLREADGKAASPGGVWPATGRGEADTPTTEETP